MSTLRDAAMKSKAWPFEEARALLKRTEHKAHDKGYVLFETGYGPSGLPHIGTFGEVARGSRSGPVKRQYWVRTGRQWKIFFEGNIR